MSKEGEYYHSLVEAQKDVEGEAKDVRVDDGPISPLERRNSLEKHLQTRPDEQSLKNRHILLDSTAAPALQARQAELERQRITDNLKKGLAKRPEREELVERNVLAGSAAAPALQEKQRGLEREMRKDSLEKGIKGRVGREELVAKGWLGKEGEEEAVV